VRRVVAGLEAGRVLVVAGAGYGKTTLLAESLAGLGIPAGWCSCDERLTSPGLLAHVSATLGECVPGLGAGVDLDGDVVEQVEALCNEIATAAPDDLALVVDDVHALTPAAQGALAALARDLPPNVHLALASRPPAPDWLPAAASAGGLVLRSGDLALTEDETSELLRRRSSGAGRPEADALHEITEGWITGVILGSQAGEGLTRIAPGLDDSGLFDYLAGEVLEGQPAATQRFLLQTSVLDRFTPEVAAAVTGSTSAAELCRALVSGHVFTERLAADGEWYRYHHLFRAFLRSRLDDGDPSAAPGLHRRAAEAYRALGHMPEAVAHLLEAGDHEAAAELIEPVAEGMIDTSEMETLAGWLERIPVELRANRPALVLAHAGLLVERVDFERAFAAAEDAARQLISRGEHARAAVVLTRLILAMISAGTPHQDGLDTVEPFLPMLDPETPTRPALLVALASRYGHAARYEEGRALVAEALAAPGAAQSRELAVFAGSVTAFFLDHPQGRSAAALDRFGDIVAEIRSARWPNAAAHGNYARAFRALILNDLNRFDEALDAADALETGADRWSARRARRVVAWVRVAALAGLGRWADVERLLPGARATVEGIERSTYRYRYESVAARLAAAKGDDAGARRLIARTRDLLAVAGYPFQRSLILADMASTSCAIGQAHEALAMAREAAAAADAARAPLGRLRAGAALALALPEGPERDRQIASALELSRDEGLAPLWAGDAAGLAAILARALRAGLGPPGAARTVITARADPLLAACAPLLTDAPPPARAELAAAAGEATGGDPSVLEGLLRDPDQSVRRAARAGRRRLRAARPPLRLGGLGGFRVHRGEVPVPATAFGSDGARRLLAALLCAGGAVPRERLADWLWPDAPPERARRRLSDAVRRLRRALEPEMEEAPEESVVVATEAGLSLRLRQDDEWDVTRFLERAQEALATEPGAARAGELAAAEAAYGGPLYPEWPGAAWSEDRRRQLVDLLARVLEALADELAGAGDAGAVVGPCERLVALQPDREGHHRRLMRAYAAAGDQPSALRQYHACRVVLRQSADAQPSPEMRGLYADLLAGRDPMAEEEYRDLPPDGSVTIMFTDIEGSTALAERLGDDRWMDVLRGHDAIVRAQVRAHGGREVKAQGDGFMLAFPSARAGVACAVALQRALALDGRASPQPRLAVRVGLHTGEAVREGDDLFGRSVMVAARVAASAEGGQIAVSEAVRRQLDDAGDEVLTDAGRELPLRGLAGRHRIYLVDWAVQEVAG
jgi:ATP/maltotriose-dependent transcriptional regulator MalT/class 3 adenylate cyclase